MKRLKKGPELKMPELKVPPFLMDLYYDLRDRRLLPLVALIVVAIFAVPFLLGGGSTEPATPSPGAAVPSTVPAVKSGSAELTVVKAKPGLREYHKRLGHRTATNPFKQRYTGPILKGSELNSQSTTTSSTTESVTSTSTTTGEGENSGGSSTGTGANPHLVLFRFAADLQISHTETTAGGATKMSEPSTRQKVLAPTPLPGPKAPVVTYMGLGQNKGALLMVSNNVTTVEGEGKCLSGTDTCQLLEVELGFPEIFVYGPNDVRYKINVLKIEPVVVGHS